MINICKHLKTRLLLKSSFRRFSTNIISTTDFYILCKRGGYQDVSFKIFCLTVSRTFVGEQFGVSETFGSRKFSCIGGGRHHGFVENFLAQRTEKLRKGSLLCFRSFLVSRKIMDKRWGVSQFSFGNFSSHMTKSFVRGSFCVSESFRYGKKIMDKRWGGGVYHSAKKFRGEPFNVSENFGYRKILCMRRGFHYSPMKIFRLTVPKKFVREPFCVLKKFRYQKFSCIGEGGGGITVLSKKILSHRTETKNLVRESPCFPENFWYQKKFMGKRKRERERERERERGGGVITVLLSKIVNVSEVVKLSDTAEIRSLA